MQDYKNLKVWGKSNQFVIELYKVTRDFPKNEMYGLTSQIRRASVSIPANLAEGCGKDSQMELARYATIASGSASEVEYLIELSHQLSYIDKNKFNRLSNEIAEIKKMLRAFVDKIKKNKKTNI